MMMAKLINVLLLLFMGLLCAGADGNIVGNVQDVIEKNDGDGDSAFIDDIEDIVQPDNIENVDHLAADGEIFT